MSNITYSVLSLIFIVSFISCRTDMACGDERAAGRIIKAAFPESVSAQEEFIIHLKVMKPPGMCVDEATASIETVGQDSFLIRSQIRYTEEYIDGHCDCDSTPELDAAVYFKSSTPGKFVFIYNDDESNIASAPGYFSVTVE